jgi:hypothetical protein
LTHEVDTASEAEPADLRFEDRSELSFSRYHPMQIGVAAFQLLGCPYERCVILVGDERCYVHRHTFGRCQTEEVSYAERRGGPRTIQRDPRVNDSDALRPHAAPREHSGDGV